MEANTNGTERKNTARTGAGNHGIVPEGPRYDFEMFENPRRAAQRNGRRGVIYFVAYADGPVKIGFTSNFEYRFAGLQTACPYDLTILARVEGTLADEADYHDRFAAHRLRGEWFAPHPDIIAEIERLT